MIKEILIILVISAAAAGATKWLHPKAPALYLQNEPLEENQVTLEIVEERWKGEVLWVDARTRKEYEKSHRDGAILLNEEDWADLMWDNRDKLENIGEKPVVVYCDGSTCERSHRIAEMLRQNVALEDVYVLRGDWRGE